MPNDAQNLGNTLLAEFEKAFETSTEPKQEPIVPTVVVPAVVVPTTTPPADDTQQVINQQTNQEEETVDDEVSYLTDFAKGLGIEDYQHDAQKPVNINTFLEIAKERIQAIEENYAAFSNPVVQQFAQFVNDGGNIQDFIEIASYELQYENVVLDSTDVNQAETLIRQANDSRGVPTYITDAAVSALKENGQIFNVAKDQLKYLQDADKARYDALVADKESKLAAEKEEIVTFFKGINEAFKGNDFTGFKIPDTEVEVVRGLSLPDNTGNIGINEMIDSLTVQQKALLNYAAYKIAKGETFNVAFTGKKGNRMEEPITKMFSKGVAGGGGNKSQMSVTEFESALAGLNG